MEYSVVPKIDIREDKCVKIGSFLYDKERDGLYLDSPWPFPVQLGFTDGLSKAEVTPMFLKLPFVLKGWINHDILIREVELLKMVLEDKILMHASCVDHTLIVGLPTSGKTYQTYKEVSKGGQLISEEYTVLYKNNTAWLASPYKRIMKTCFSGRTIKDCGIKISLKEKIWLFFTSLRAFLFPFMYEAVIWKSIPSSGRSAYIEKIVYGSTGTEIKNWKQFAILCENEFPFMANEFLQAYALASGLDLIAIQESQRNLIKEFVESVYPINHSA